MEYSKDLSSLEEFKAQSSNLNTTKTQYHHQGLKKKKEHSFLLDSN
jgi:hypothetical protein